MRLTTSIVVILALAACGSPTGPSRNSNVRIMLKDSPFTDAKAVLVTFSSVRAHRADGDWTDVPFAGGATTRTCDLKRLQTSQDILGTGALPAGHYTMLRLVVSSATIYFDNVSSGSACDTTMSAPGGANAPLEIPSGEVKLNRGFDLTTDKTTTIVLDFDGDHSIHRTGSGNYMMSPVIAIVSVQ
jgi:hypothetical protein